MWTVRDTKTQEVTVLNSQAPSVSGNHVNGKNLSSAKVNQGRTKKMTERKRKREVSATDGGSTLHEPASKNKKQQRKEKRRRGNGGTALTAVESLPVEFNAIPWSEVHTHEGFLMGDNQGPGGFLCLEEIDGVDVEYETGAGGGKVIKFKKVKELKAQGKPARPDVPPTPSEMEGFISIDDFAEGADTMEDEAEDDAADAAEVMDTHAETAAEEIASENEVRETGSKSSISIEPADVGQDMSAWEAMGLAPVLVQGLAALKFCTPTEIQQSTLPLVLDGKRDVIGAAQTGSGKTLAFGLPILQSIALRTTTAKDPGLHALILTPTRELALQVTEHLKQVARFMKAKIVPIVGGISVPKQKRLISTKPDIIIGTPGRLWELVSEDAALLARLRGIKYLAIDEADRMLERGHFRELDNILKAVSVKHRAKQSTIERRTFIFSATLVHDGRLKQKLKKGSKKQSSHVPSMDDLLDRLEFQDPEPCYVNVLPESVTADKLLETRIDCLHTEKDAFLYYILTRYPGRTIVFVNSIDAIRRLVPVLSHMKVKALPLHAEMQQRQRLKNLDRFRESKDAVLVASDVAARGLDIPNIEHVVHYQLPRTADLYVHRSGRTARAASDGISVMLCSPQEVPVYKRICHILGKEDGIPEFPLDRSLLTGIKQRMALAKQIDELEHRKQKTQHEKNWFKKAAEEADIELDEDFLDTKSATDKGNASTDAEEARRKAKLQSLKAELSSLLAQPLVPKGISGLYLTSNVDSTLPDVLIDTAETDTKLPTHRRTTAAQDIKRNGKEIRGKK
ncbi:uncharacterized protein SPPG_01605 [Spizellomyces punctatus DAOM BR117]|uniref:RNA helicase n=1 Tax=Spizellomyces punctatus (strain DAOM BR117) TaxID=645134 RepID=A0A0L0HS37_SPIPD|nr:uncharacterized protein SPPG_01605 [Spizellomyces punctatus DAOM BR117]KND04171.1 hypothetical protein SPPG_01605 [Spizellomyces punctatus DAOM BR117]|eukprot:XP_016612210.1 hypothetical protein SPPG_01605 [Spizellomyces punctatus DAOM BR117]